MASADPFERIKAAIGPELVESRKRQFEVNQEKRSRRAFERRRAQDTLCGLIPKRLDGDIDTPRLIERALMALYDHFSDIDDVECPFMMASPFPFPSCNQIIAQNLCYKINEILAPFGLSLAIVQSNKYNPRWVCISYRDGVVDRPSSSALQCLDGRILSDKIESWIHKRAAEKIEQLAALIEADPAAAALPGATYSVPCRPFDYNIVTEIESELDRNGIPYQAYHEVNEAGDTVSLRFAWK